MLIQCTTLDPKMLVFMLKFLNCLATLRTIAKHNDHFSILSSSNNSSGSSYIDSDEISKIIHVCYTAYNSQLKFVHKFNYDLDTIIAANSFINISKNFLQKLAI